MYLTLSSLQYSREPAGGFYPVHTFSPRSHTVFRWDTSQYYRPVNAYVLSVVSSRPFHRIYDFFTQYLERYQVSFPNT